MTDRLAKEQKYAVELEERTKELREILSETLSVKLKYEEIIKQVIEGEKLGKTRPIGEIIRSTPAPMSTALKAVNVIWPRPETHISYQEDPNKEKAISEKDGENLAKFQSQSSGHAYESCNITLS